MVLPNVSSAVVDSVRSLLQLRHPQFEVVGVDHPASRYAQYLVVEYFRRFYADIAAFSPGAVNVARDFLGADHLVFGSDYPFDMGVDDPVGFVQRGKLSEDISRDQLTFANYLLPAF